MNYDIIPTYKFKREAKRLVSKYQPLALELLELNEALSKEPAIGKSLGGNKFKIRMATESKVKGKSGGARIITYIVTESKEVDLLTIYDKAEFDSIDDKILQKIMREIALPKRS